MKRKRWVLFAVLVALLIGGGFGVLGWMNRPMNQALTFQTPIQNIAPTAEQAIPAQITEPVDITTAPAMTMPAALQPLQHTEAANICGNAGIMRLLVVGLTTPTEEELLAADAIRLVTVNFHQPSATIMTLPAVLWVDTPVLADIGVKQIQLTMVYSLAYSSAQGYPERVRAQKATQAMAQTILDNFGFEPDHYITVDEGAFVKYVNTLGGIEISLPKAVDGTSEGYGIYPEGSQLLSGTRALNFARLFHPSGIKQYDVWGNLERQNIVVKGILAATLKPQNWTKIPLTSLFKIQRNSLRSCPKSIGQLLHILTRLDSMGA